MRLSWAWVKYIGLEVGLDWLFLNSGWVRVSHQPDQHAQVATLAFIKVFFDGFISLMIDLHEQITKNTYSEKLW